MAAPSIRPIRNCLYGRPIGCERRHCLCRERLLARRRALAFRRGVPGRAARAHIIERPSDLLYLHSTVDENAMIRSRYNRIPHPAPDTKREWNKNN